MLSAEPVSCNLLFGVTFIVCFLWKDDFCYIWGTFRTIVDCEVSVIHVMIKWEFCAKPAWLWFLINVLMHHPPPNITANGKNNLKMKTFYHRCLHQLCCPLSRHTFISWCVWNAVSSSWCFVFFVCHQTMTPLLSGLISVCRGNERAWCRLMEAAGDNISDGRLGSQYKMRGMENFLKASAREQDNKPNASDMGIVIYWNVV